MPVRIMPCWSLAVAVFVFGVFAFGGEAPAPGAAAARSPGGSVPPAASKPTGEAPVAPKPTGEAPVAPPPATKAEKKDERQEEKKEAKTPTEEKEIVVTAERLPTPREATGVEVTTITAKQLEEDQTIRAADALRLVPGVSIHQAGRAGDMTEIRTRGGESDHTLILFDGWKVNRAGGGKFFNFESLDPVGADRIEIARGPSSALFGSEAMTGTVNLLARKGEGRPELTTSAAGGTYGTDRETFSMQGREGKFSYHVDSSRLHREQATVPNSEVSNYNYAARFDYDINSDHALKLVVRGVDFEKGWYEHTASGFGTAVDTPDPNDTVRNQDRLIGFEYAGRVVPIWETILRAGHYGLDLDFDSKKPNPFDAATGFFQNPDGIEKTHERRNSLEWRNNVTAFETQDIRDVVTLGAYGEHELYTQSDSTFYDSTFHRHHLNYAGYVQNRLELFGRAFITLGGRHEETEEFGGFDTGRADVSILIPESDTRVHGSVGNAFRAPSFFELFSPFFGNATLAPEKNCAYDLGVEQHFWKKRIRLGATWFHNDFKDLISFDPDTFKTINVGTAVTRGFELEAAIRPVKQLSLEGNATLMSTEDDQGRRLARRPPHTYTGRLVVHPLVDVAPAKLDGLDLSFEVLNVATRTDSTLYADGMIHARARNPGYTRADLAVSYRFLDHFRAFVRFANLTDKKYEEVLTFPSDGATVLGGLEFRWRF